MKFILAHSQSILTTLNFINERRFTYKTFKGNLNMIVNLYSRLYSLFLNRMYHILARSSLTQ